jgi:hypothetical protein
MNEFAAVRSGRKTDLRIRLSRAVALTLSVVALAACGGASATHKIAALIEQQWPPAQRACVTPIVRLSHDKGWASVSEAISRSERCSSLELEGTKLLLRESSAGGWRVVWQDYGGGPSCSMHAPRDVAPMCIPPAWKQCVQGWNQQTTTPDGGTLSDFAYSAYQNFGAQPVAYLRAAGNSCRVMVTIGSGVFEDFSGVGGYDTYGLSQTAPQEMSSRLRWHYTSLNEDGTLGPDWLVFGG